MTPPNAALLAQFARLADVKPGPACVKGVEVWRDYSKDICPVDKGNLKESIAAIEVEDGALWSAFGDYGEPRSYAVFVEFGTVKMDKQPYMRPPLDEHQPEIVAAVGAQIQEQLKGNLNG
jgi:HK97 gp10 family phage protein